MVIMQSIPILYFPFPQIDTLSWVQRHRIHAKMVDGVAVHLVLGLGDDMDATVLAEEPAGGPARAEAVVTQLGPGGGRDELKLAELVVGVGLEVDGDVVGAPTEGAVALGRALWRQLRSELVAKIAAVAAASVGLCLGHGWCSQNEEMLRRGQRSCHNHMRRVHIRNVMLSN